MNIIENNVDALNTIIFQNRNKSYGAYVIRSEYGNTIFKSLGITILIFACISAMAIMLNRTVDEEKKIEIGPNILPPIPTTKVTEVIITPPKGHDLITPPQHVEIVHSTAVLSTNIVDSAIEHTITTTNLNANPVVTNNTNGNTNTGENPEGGKGKPGIESGTETGTNANTVVMVPEVMPKFDNLPAFLQKNLRYPEMAKEQNVTGKVYVSFVVDEEGRIMNATVLKGIGFGCNEEALRVVRLIPKATPGYMGKKAVKVSLVQAIDFRLQ